MTISRRRHRFVEPQRNNSGVVLPEFVLHAALRDLPEKLGRGEYGKGGLEEPLVRVVRGLDQNMINSVFENLRRKPPSVGLEFPSDPQHLPSIFVTTESMHSEAPVLADDVGVVEQEINTYETPLDIVASAAGGEYEVYIPAEGDLVTRMLELRLDPSIGDEQELVEGEDYFVDAASKRVELFSPLAAGDRLYAYRWASYGLPGGDLYGNTFRCTFVVFIDTENPVVTSVLKGLVWREFTLKTNSILASGLADLNYSVRYQSIWNDIAPAIGHRCELVVDCLTTWIAYDRTPTIKSASGELTAFTNKDDEGTVLECTAELYRWAEDDELEEE